MNTANLNLDDKNKDISGEDQIIRFTKNKDIILATTLENALVINAWYPNPCFNNWCPFVTAGTLVISPVAPVVIAVTLP